MSTGGTVVDGSPAGREGAVTGAGAVWVGGEAQAARTTAANATATSGFIRRACEMGCESPFNDGDSKTANKLRRRAAYEKRDSMKFTAGEQPPSNSLS